MKSSLAQPLRFNVITTTEMNIGADGFSSAFLEPRQWDKDTELVMLVSVILTKQFSS